MCTAGEFLGAILARVIGRSTGSGSIRVELRQITGSNTVLRNGEDHRDGLDLRDDQQTRPRIGGLDIVAGVNQAAGPTRPVIGAVILQ